VAQETNRRFLNTLRVRWVRTASTVLHHSATPGEIHLVQSGGTAHEALYSKGGRG